MEYTISLSKSGDYIIIKSYLPLTTEIGRRFGIEATRLSNEKNLKKFLFDFRGAPNVQSVSKNIAFAKKELDGFGFPRTACSAILVSPNDKSHDFIVKVFNNAGFNVKLFTDESAAIHWLENE